jgi:hypothetical protein
MCSLDVYDQGLMLTLILGHIYLKNTWLDTFSIDCNINPWSYTSKEHMVRHPLL